MVVSLRRWFRRFVFVMLLAVLTFVTYGGCRYIAVWINPVDPYRVPQGGHALKVFNANDVSVEDADLADRLRLFYWYGE